MSMDSLAQSGFIVTQVFTILGLAVVAYFSGTLALRGFKVNYTRKIVHFTVFFLPFFFTDFFPYTPTLATSVFSGILLAVLILFITKPVRERIRFIKVIFASIDRPEDRPHTVLWLSTQVIAGFAVLVPLAYMLYVRGQYKLIYIPLLINGIGDGLAEPVGVKFGKRRYKARAIFSKKSYTRTFAGSVCVFVSSILAVLFFHGNFTDTQLWAASIAMPVAMTIAEAVAPHTWDSPFLFLIGGTVLLTIIEFV
ncbi:hypothetical protein CHISP_1760 [Chitinispirillum alkaliphilum]|nr:hypothetical protein CHISP_1760 [Chitinispirillum alkaliphilum]